MQYEPFLRQLARRRGVPERHVPDVVQQILLAVARSIDGGTADGHDASFCRWGSTVARNVVIKFMTRECKHDAAGGTDRVELLTQIPSEPDVSHVSDYEHELIVWAAEQVRSELQTNSWLAFTGTLVEGRSVAEMSDELGVSAGSIYMSRSRILARIRTKIETLFEK